jgi:hypothetical protein
VSTYSNHFCYRDVELHHSIETGHYLQWDVSGSISPLSQVVIIRFVVAAEPKIAAKDIHTIIIMHRGRNQAKFISFHQIPIASGWS